MNDTVTPVTRCQTCRIKSKSEKFPSLLVTHSNVFLQRTMTRHAACRRFARLLQTYVVALSFNVLRISLGTCYFQNGPSLAGASSVLPAKQDSIRTSTTGVLSTGMLRFPAPEGSDGMPSELDTTEPDESASTGGLQKQSLSQWTHNTGESEALSDGKLLLRPATTSLALPWDVIGSVLPAYLLVLEHELCAALKKLSPARWKAVGNTALRAESGSSPFPRSFREGEAPESTLCTFLRAAGVLPEHEDSIDVPGGVFDGHVQNAAEVWQGFHALAEANGYVSTGLLSVEKGGHEAAPAPAQEHAYMRVAPSDHLLLRRARRTVHLILNDIAALASVQKLVSDFARRLHYSLQAEQQLVNRIGCLAAPDSQSDKSVKGGTESQPGENRCEVFSGPQNEEDRRALRHALEKQLNDLQQAAKNAAQVLFSILSTPEFDSPFARHNISLLCKQTSPLTAGAPPLLEQPQRSPNVKVLQDVPASNAESEENVTQARPHAPSKESNKAESPGLAPRSLASASMLRGQTLFGKDMQSRPTIQPGPLQASPKRPSSQSAGYYGQRQVYRCHRRPSEAQQEDLLTCECKHVPEPVPESQVLQPVLCTIVSRRSSHRPPPVTTVEQALECYPSAPEVGYTQKHIEAVPRTNMAYTAAPARPLLPAAEAPLQCECHSPRTQYECTYVPPRVYPQRETISVVPEVMEHRVTEPVLMPVECEIVPRQEVYVPAPLPVPETVLVPCECIEHGVRVTESYMPKQTDLYSAAPRESVLIPVECVLRSPQPERVPCECIARQVPDSAAYMRTPAEYAPYLECVCSKEEHLGPVGYGAPAYSYELAE